MECSQAVLMLMLLVPCEQSGGKTPETVIAEELKPAPVVQAVPLRAPAAELSATDAAAASSKAASPAPAESPEPTAGSAQRVSD